VSYLDPVQLAGVNGLNGVSGWFDDVTSFVSDTASQAWYGNPCRKWKDDSSYAGRLALKSCQTHLDRFPDDRSGALRSGELMYSEAIEPCKEWKGRSTDQDAQAFMACSNQLRSNPKDPDAAYRAGYKAYQQIMEERRAMQRPPAP